MNSTHNLPICLREFRQYEDPFCKVYEPNFLKNFIISISVILTLASCIGSYGCLWYEYSASDHYTTLMHKLSVKLHAVGFVVVPVHQFQIILRYLFLFHIKNPMAIDDNFWDLVFLLWSIMTSFIISIVDFLNRVKLPITYLLCAGEDHTNQFNLRNAFMGYFEVFSFVVHLVVKLKILRLKSRKKETEIIPKNFLRKDEELFHLDKKSFADFVPNVALIVLIGLIALLNQIQTYSTLDEMNQYPNNWFIFIQVVLGAPTIGVTLNFLFYYRNVKLRKKFFHFLIYRFQFHEAVFTLQTT